MLADARSGFLLAYLLVGTTVFGAEEPPEARAATQVIQSLEGVLGNLSAVRNLPPTPRVAWVLNEATQRVQDKVVGDARERLSKAMEDYALAAFRAKAFENVAVPALKNAMVLGSTVDWPLLQTRMLSEVDTKTRAYGKALTGVSIVWGAVDAFSTSGANAGFSKLAAGVYSAVAEAYIPGWSWFSMGISLVDALGNYVLGYATDTAVEGMLEDVFAMKSDPRGFARRLQTASPDQLYQEIEDGWELVAAGRLWPGQGTDAGDEAMKQRLKATLKDLQARLAQELEKQRRKDAELQAQMQPYLDAAARAEAELKAVAADTTARARPLLEAIQGFQGRSSAVRESDARSTAQTYAAQAATAPGDLLPYVPLPRDAIVNAYNVAYAMCRETPGGAFSGLDFTRALQDAGQVKSQVVHGQPAPDVNTPGYQQWEVHRTADRLALDAEIAVLDSQAKQRLAKQEAAIRSRVAELAAELEAGAVQLENGLLAVEKAAAANLSEPDTVVRYFRPDFLGDYTENWLTRRPFTYDSLDPVGNDAKLDALRQTLEAERSTFQSLDERRRRLYSAFEEVVMSVDLEMRSTIPEGCQEFSVRRGYDILVEWQWAVTNYPYFTHGNIYLTATQVKPDYVNGGFKIDTALARIKARQAELQPAHDEAELRRRLQRVVGVLEGQFAPVAIPPGMGAYEYALSIRGRVDDVVDFRQPMERSDLARRAARLATVWEAAQPRLALLGRHPAHVDAVQLAALRKHGDDLAALQRALGIDQIMRTSAPDQAANLIAGYRQTLARWAPSPPWGWTLADYEDALGGMANTLGLAQRDLRRARAAADPGYALMASDLEAYLPQVTALLLKYQSDYARNMPAFSKTLPTLTLGAATVVAPRGSSVRIEPRASEPGGTFSCPNLPPGLTVDPAAGVITGTPQQAGGNYDVVVCYTSTSGVTARELVRLELKDAAPPRVRLAIRDGISVLSLEGEPGVTYRIQASDLQPGSWWSSVASLTLTGSEQTWSDPHAASLPARSYRAVWVP